MWARAHALITRVSAQFLWRWAYVLSALGTMLVLYIAYTIYVAYREAKVKRD